MRPIIRLTLFAVLSCCTSRVIRDVRCEFFRRKSYYKTRDGLTWLCALCWDAITVSNDVMASRRARRRV